MQPHARDQSSYQAIIERRKNEKAKLYSKLDSKLDSLNKSLQILYYLIH